MDPIVVTATRVPTPLSSSTQAVTVLDGDDLRNRGVMTVAQALREVPGASVVQSGSYGGVTSLFLRGGESRYTKVLIDGVPINMVGGQFAFENLTMDNVGRIEIVRGPGSAIYGSDAMSGEIQIFTKRGRGAPRLDASMRAGTYGSRDGDMSMRGGNNIAGYSLSGGLHRTDGILSFNNNYYNGTLSGAVTVTPDSQTSIDISSRYIGSEFHYPTDFTGTPSDSNSYTVQHRLVLGLDVARRLFSHLTLHLIGADNEVHDLSKDMTRSGVNNDSVTQQSDPGTGFHRVGEIRAVAPFGPLATLTLGGAYEDEYQRTTQILRSGDVSIMTGPGGTITTTSTANNRVTHGYYAAVQGTPINRLTYDASVRYDNHSDYKNVTTYHTGMNVGLLSDTRLRLSYGTAFNAPAFYESQGSAYNQANGSLQPEQAHTVDVALEQALLNGRVRASIGAFDQHFSQLIQYINAVTSGPPDFNTIVPAYYDNVTEARAKGYEGELHTILLQGLTADASYTQTIAKIYKVPPSYAGSMTAGQELLRRPSHSGDLKVMYARPGTGSLSATAIYVGKRPDQDFSQFPSPTVTLPSYVRLDLSTSVEVLHDGLRSVALTGRVENALNTQYQDVLHFQAPGRAMLAGVSISGLR
jgi:vitamin B12 transporter